MRRRTEWASPPLTNIALPHRETTMTDCTLDILQPEVALRPMVAIGASQPFAWQAVATARLPPAQRITRALERAVAAGLLGSDALLAIPVGGEEAEMLLSHLFRTALAHRFPLDRIVVEVSADELGDREAAAALVKACNTRGLAVALDAFAAGPVALHLLARFTPRFVKLDGSLVRRIDASPSRRAIVESVMRLARGMGVTVIATGTQTRGEIRALAGLGLCHIEADWFAPSRRAKPASSPERGPSRNGGGEECRRPGRAGPLSRFRGAIEGRPGFALPARPLYARPDGRSDHHSPPLRPPLRAQAAPGPVRARRAVAARDERARNRPARCPHAVR